MRVWYREYRVTNRIIDMSVSLHIKTCLQPHTKLKDYIHLYFYQIFCHTAENGKHLQHLKYIFHTIFHLLILIVGKIYGDNNIHQAKQVKF